jgi:putative endonuclease
MDDIDLSGPRSRRPAGPRGRTGAEAEDAAALHLVAIGWSIMVRNVRVGRDEIDIVAREPGPDGTIVVVEVRSRSTSDFGTAVESVDAAKVGRLYRAAETMRRGGHPALPAGYRPSDLWRVDLVTMVRRPSGHWRLETHLRGLTPP